jgi:two-component system sensor histidine kinase BarA
MRIRWKFIWVKVLRVLRLTPLSLAEKCRVAFGAAVVLTLALALLIPYIWMRQLTKQISLEAARAKVEMLLRDHFKLTGGKEAGLAALDVEGGVLDSNDPQIRWIRFQKDAAEQRDQLSEEQQEMVESIRGEGEREDAIRFTEKEGIAYSNYVRIFRARDACISCHNPQGSAGPLGLNEAVGAIVIERPAGEVGRASLLNRVWITVAFLIAGAGAFVAFYMITQRVILRPVRQLRAIANNVAEGNLDIRSAIKTGDEYEKLARAFNHMLDSLRGAQEKLRQANKQLDEKIVELSERNIELFKANKIKGEFLANISHEFRTPLNAILGFAEILREKPEILSKEKGRRYAENIIVGGKNLLNMINDLLDLAKTEAGKMELHIEKTSIPQLCKSVVGSFAALTKGKKIKVKLSTDSDIPELMTDAGKVRQILYNFLSNSVKFTPERGRIEIRANMLDDQTVRIGVTDTGRGIAEQDKEKIFEKFRQADGSITRGSAGSGLGLAISKELAAMLAGSVGMESEAGKGSTFWVDIPVSITKEVEQAS